MRRVTDVEWMSLDGVILSAGADDDTTGGFKHGGWHLPYFDDVSQNWVAEGYSEASGFLFGRRTYELLAGYWPNASDEEQPIAPAGRAVTTSNGGRGQSPPAASPEESSCWPLPMSTGSPSEPKTTREMLRRRLTTGDTVPPIRTNTTPTK